MYNDSFAQNIIIMLVAHFYMITADVEELCYRQLQIKHYLYCAVVSYGAIV